MSNLKPGTGDATRHPTNKQNGGGKGVTNVPLKKSTTNKAAPLLKEANPAGKNVDKAPKINAEAMGKRVIQGDAKPNKHVSTFTAPRKEGSHDPLMAGYTRPGKM